MRSSSYLEHLIYHLWGHLDRKPTDIKTLNVDTKQNEIAAALIGNLKRSNSLPRAQMFKGLNPVSPSLIFLHAYCPCSWCPCIWQTQTETAQGPPFPGAIPPRCRPIPLHTVQMQAETHWPPDHFLPGGCNPATQPSCCCSKKDNTFAYFMDLPAVEHLQSNILPAPGK